MNNSSNALTGITARETSGNDHQIVSCDSELLILVDTQDQELGFESKGRCHDHDGVLHRAFSLFVFNSKGELLLQQRSAAKRLWPLYWSNTCCSHPRQGETMELATGRRLQQELGFTCDLNFVYKFEYQARYQDLGAEHELCSVYTGISDTPIHPNANEVVACRWLTPAAIDRELEQFPEHFTPWFKLEWAQIRSQSLPV